MKKTIRLLLPILASVFVLQLAGCATGPSESWVHVRPGMDREMVQALLGPPKFTNPGGIEEIYAQPTAMDGNGNPWYSELHVQYDAGGKVARYYHFYTHP